MSRHIYSSFSLTRLGYQTPRSLTHTTWNGTSNTSTSSQSLIQNSSTPISDSVATSSRVTSSGDVLFETNYGFRVKAYIGDIAGSNTQAIATEETTQEEQRCQTIDDLEMVFSGLDKKRHILFGINHNKLTEGDVYYSLVSQRKTKYIFHAVVPQYYRETHWKSKMADLYTKILEKADLWSCESVSIPLILGDGNDRLAPYSIEAAVEALKQFGPRALRLKEIDFVFSSDLDRATFAYKMTGNHLDTSATTSSNNFSPPNSILTHSATGLRRTSNKAKADAAVFEISNGIKVYVYLGNIAMSDASAIVTGEGTRFKAKSSVTRVLSKFFSPDFNRSRSDLFTFHHGMLTEGDVYHTMIDAQKLRYILHAVVPLLHDIGMWKKQMTRLYRKVFKEAEQCKCTSVALPLLGTSQGDSCIEYSIEAAVCGLKEYAERPKATVKEVEFVVLEDTLKEVIVRQLQNMFSDMTGCGMEASGGNTSDVASANQNLSDQAMPSSSTASETSVRQKQRKSSFMRTGNDIKHVTTVNHDSNGRKESSPTYKTSATASIRDEGHSHSADSEGSKNPSNSEEHDDDDNVVIPGKSEKQANHLPDERGESEDDDADRQKSDTEEEASETCPICMDDMTDPVTLKKCRHVFCRGCIKESFQKHKPVCPSCQMTYGQIKGNMPINGHMTDTVDRHSHLPGYKGCGTIVISYVLPDGRQTSEHPNPGVRYRGTRRTAYLPDNTEGRKVLELLKVAWDRRLTFTIGRSTTTGQDNIVTWNDIHHKTNQVGGPARFGYPDDTYLSRVTEELASKGVTEELASKGVTEEDLYNTQSRADTDTDTYWE